MIVDLALLDTFAMMETQFPSHAILDTIARLVRVLLLVLPANTMLSSSRMLLTIV
jgi:hypothetical protein